jgi:hypothetical protein
MRLWHRFVRISVTLALIATALAGAGWKWEAGPH